MPITPSVLHGRDPSRLLNIIKDHFWPIAASIEGLQPTQSGYLM
jgi:hypothetical protein